MHKLLAIIVALFTLISSPLRAHDGDSSHTHNVTYVGTMSGIDCTGCKKTIAKAIGKLKGVKTIRIQKISENSHRLTVITDGSQSISKSQAVKALGKNVDHYKIVGWRKA